MATGRISTNDASQVVIRLLDAATATTAVPVYADDGVDVGEIIDEVYGTAGRPEYGHLHIYTTAGSDTMTATTKLWAGYLTSGSTGRYSAASPGAAAAAGVLNGGAASDEHATDNINRTEVVFFGRVFPRKLAVQVTAIGGTATAVTVDLILPAVNS